MKITNFVDLKLPVKIIITVILLMFILLSAGFKDTFARNLGYIELMVIAGLGISCYLHGFKLLSKRRYIEDIPISKAGSLALGQVKLKCTALPGKLLSSYSEQPCVYYQYETIQNEDSGIVTGGSSENQIFYAGDETGYIVVNPSGMESRLKDQEIGYDKNINKMISEYVIQPGDMIYIIGNAMKAEINTDSPITEKISIYENIRKLKESPEELYRIDKNHDGKIDEKEWTDAINNLKDKTRKNIELGKVNNDFGKMTIGRDNVRRIFIVLKEWEYNEYMKRLLYRGVGDIIWGTLMASIILCFLYWFLLANCDLLGYIHYLFAGYSSI